MNFIIDNFDKLFNSEESLKRLEEIILDLAVKGKLVSQDPKDEPASILLEKIKEEKEQLLEVNKSKKEKQETQPIDVPKHWESIRLGDCARVINGATFDKKEVKYEKKDDYVFVIRGGNIQNDVFVNAHDDTFIPKIRIKDEMLIQLGDTLIVSSSGTLTSVGKSILVKKSMLETVTGAFLLTIRPLGGLIPEFLHLNIKIIREKIIRDLTGTSISNIKKSVLENYLLPLPPLAEQKRIVEKVDKLKELINQFREKIQKRDKVRQGLKASIMNEIEKSNSNHDLLENLELIFRNFDSVVKTKEDIKDIRDLVLSLAVKGKLVPQDPNDEPASILLEKIKAEKEQLIKDKKIKKDKDLATISEEEIPFEIPESWEFSRLVEITETITDGTHQTPRYVDNGRMFLSAQNVKPFRFMPENYRTVSEEDYQGYIKNTKAEYEDILVTRVGAGIGESAVINKKIDFAIYVSLGLIKPFKEYIDSYYLNIWINSPFGQRTCKSNILGKGTSQGNLNLSLIRNFTIPLPPHAEQKRIVLQVEKLMKVCDELEKLVEKSQKEESLLMGSIMKGLVG